MTQAFTPGDRLGRYELVNVVGGGGFAAVWRARTVGPGGFARDVAVKVMRPGRASLKRFRDMLLDEARLVARIQHPNVAQIWEVGEDPRSLYIVMELVEGQSLDDLRFHAEERGSSLPIRALFRILADTCGGLHAAHELTVDGVTLGLVHRDVSPQNILVSRHGTAKLIDFGIAKAKERLVADTTTGFIKGKISYMAPEQARTEELDRRADVWAVGAVAYEMITGKSPCEGFTDLGRLAALVSPTPVPPLPDTVPEPLRRVVARALQKDRDARYPTALALREAIEEALIESELETSDADVAALLAADFGVSVSERPRPSSGSAGVSVAATGGLDVPPQSLARPDVGRVEPAAESEPMPGAVATETRLASDAPAVPMRRRRYALAAVLAAAAAVGVGVYGLTRSVAAPSNIVVGTAASSGRDAPSPTLLVRDGSAPLPTAKPTPSGPETAAGSPSVAASVSASPTNPPLAPKVPYTPRVPPRPWAPRPPTDENAIE